MDSDVTLEPVPTKEQKKEAVYRELQGALIFLLAFFMVATVLVIGYRQSTGRGILNDVRKSTNILVDCTTPHHPCYERGQKQSRDAVGNINQVIVLAAYCAQLHHKLNMIELCVKNGLK